MIELRTCDFVQLEVDRMEQTESIHMYKIMLENLGILANDKSVHL